MSMKYVLSVFFLLGIDFITKDLAKKYLISNTIKIVGDLLELEYSSNEGISFGMFKGDILVTYVMPLIGMGILILMYIKLIQKKKTEKIMAIVYLAGFLGNYVERLFTGQVTDFIRIKYFAIFNFADIYLSVAVCVILGRYCINEYRKKQKRETLG